MTRFATNTSANSWDACILVSGQREARWALFPHPLVRPSPKKLIQLSLDPPLKSITQPTRWSKGSTALFLKTRCIEEAKPTGPANNQVHHPWILPLRAWPATPQTSSKAHRLPRILGLYCLLKAAVTQQSPQIQKLSSCWSVKGTAISSPDMVTEPQGGQTSHQLPWMPTQANWCYFRDWNFWTQD